MQQVIMEEEWMYVWGTRGGWRVQGGVFLPDRVSVLVEAFPETQSQNLHQPASMYILLGEQKTSLNIK